nr:anti-sigma-D factor RsdA [Actinomycetota bacterium]
MNENEDVPTVLPVGLSLSAVQTDDALVESLRRETRSPEESELTRLLLAWKRDIGGAELPAQPDLPAAERALASQG